MGIIEILVVIALAAVAIYVLHHKSKSVSADVSGIEGQVTKTADTVVVDAKKVESDI